MDQEPGGKKPKIRHWSKTLEKRLDWLLTKFNAKNLNFLYVPYFVCRYRYFLRTISNNKLLTRDICPHRYVLMQIRILNPHQHSCWSARFRIQKVNTGKVLVKIPEINLEKIYFKIKQHLNKKMLFNVFSTLIWQIFGESEVCTSTSPIMRSCVDPDPTLFRSGKIVRKRILFFHG